MLSESLSFMRVINAGLTHLNFLLTIYLSPCVFIILLNTGIVKDKLVKRGACVREDLSADKP
jgi:hypothetical protein